jgi:hypothetical protein
VLRAQKGLVSRIWLSVYDAGNSAGTPDDLPTVTISSARSDDVLLTAADSTAAETGLYYFDMSPSTPTTGGVTEQLDVLTVDWDYTLNGADQTVTDTYAVVGQRLASAIAIDDRLNRGGTASDYTDRDVAAALAYAEQAMEEACRRSFTTKWRSVTFDGNGSYDIFSPDYPIQSILSCTVGGTSHDVADLELYPSGRIYNPSGWAPGRRNVTLTYEYGEPTVPAPVTRAVSLIASSVLADGPFDDRGFGVTTEGGFVKLLTAGVSGAAFSIPEVQATVYSYRRKNPLLGVRPS